METSQGAPPHGRDALPDLHHLPLSDVLRTGDSVLDNSLRRLIMELDQSPETSFAAFGNTP